MGFNINDIRAQLTYGGARGTLFQVTITNPINASGDLKIPFQCRAAALPESTLGTIMVPYFGRMLKLAGDRQFQSWQVQVMNDEDFKIRNALEEWSNRINKLEGNIRDLAGSEATLYKSQAQVSQFSKTGTLLRQYQFNGIWPNQISPIQLDWADQDKIEEFTVTFEYDWYSVVGGQTGDGGGE